ncbi:MAG: cyanophycin synthetase [Actinomycetota bacterium]|jgi:cyanophycin synthetase|nr:cyanophycin synthetase [Actinomycetota bacterium]
MSEAVTVVELRVLDGPNLYFPRPAVKLTLAVPGWTRAADTTVLRAAAGLGFSPVTPGRPGTDARLRTVARIAKQFTRSIAHAAGTRQLAVRARSDTTPDQIVIVFPWRRRGAAEALATAVAAALVLALRRAPGRVVAELGPRIANVNPGDEPTVPDPAIPVIQVTGTNGKTTTVRLLAHLVRTAGLRVAYSTTDGVYKDDGELIEPGDYSGFGGAARALAAAPDVAVLETARGGMLLRGSGVLHNDVAVVTNVSEDHLGLQGIFTVDQLAEVKAIPTRITRPDGWDVLNADDPRVLAMARNAAGRPWLFSFDPGHPAFRAVVPAGGRAMTVVDGTITWMDGHQAHPLLAVEDVPMTLAGLSRVNIANAMAAAAAALAVGIAPKAVINGLKTFVLDPERNPGRANLFLLDGRVIVVDYAHNTAGMVSLAEVLRGLCPAGHKVWLAIGTAGDRTDQILHSFSLQAALGSDHLAIAELLRYLRGRERQDVIDHLREGAAQAGATDVPAYPDELEALRAMLASARRHDVVGVTALAKRTEIFEWLSSVGATRMSSATIRRLVRRVREERAS